MSWHDLLDPAGVVGGFATGVAVGVTMVAGWLAYRQILDNREVARHESALETYNDYLRLCFDHPEFSHEDLAKEFIKVSSWVRIRDHGSLQSEQYLWFLSILLNTAEQVLRTKSTIRPWPKVLSAQMNYHRTVLREVWPHWKFRYGHEFQAFIDQVLSDIDVQRGAVAP